MVAPAGFADIVDGIYEAAFVPHKWRAVLDGIASVTGSAGGVLTAAPKVQWICSSSMENAVERYFEDGRYRRCRWVRRGLQLNNPGFVVDTNLFTPDEIVSEPSYEFFRRHGIGGAATLFMRLPTRESFVFSFDRRADDGPATRETARLLDPLRPHLAQAALIASRLGLDRSHAATQALALLGLPAAVLCARHRILAANELLQSMMPTHVDERACGRLQLADRGADALLGAALSRQSLEDFGARGPQMVSIPVPARADQPAMVLYVVPIRREARDLFTKGASLVLLTPIGGRELPSMGAIQDLFDLTAAETRVARMIAEGDTVETIATRSQVSKNTVRSQLKSVFAKTGVSRQTSLATLLNSTSIRRERIVN